MISCRELLPLSTGPEMTTAAFCSGIFSRVISATRRVSCIAPSTVERLVTERYDKTPHAFEDPIRVGDFVDMRAIANDIKTARDVAHKPAELKAILVRIGYRVQEINIRARGDIPVVHLANGVFVKEKELTNPIKPVEAMSCSNRWRGAGRGSCVTFFPSPATCPRPPRPVAAGAPGAAGARGTVL